jgi:hypothetical protein
LGDWGLAGLPVWTTDMTLTTDANGQINFQGFYGDYGLTIGGLQYDLSLNSGQSIYTVEVPEPTSLALIGTVSALLSRRRLRQS